MTKGPILTRRRALALIGGAGLAGAAAWVVTAQNAPAQTLRVADLHNEIQAGTVLLIDIRRPDEWAQTGIAQGAVPIDMRRADFADALQQARSYDTLPIAVICARGVRSRAMTERLLAAGIGPIIDVPEGMLGSFAGPGWIKSGLPVVAWKE